MKRPKDVERRPAGQPSGGFFMRRCMRGEAVSAGNAFLHWQKSVPEGMKIILLVAKSDSKDFFLGAERCYS